MDIHKMNCVPPDYK